MEIYNKISIYDIHDFLSSTLETINDFYIKGTDYNSYLDSLNSIFLKITPSNYGSDLEKFICSYLQEISIFDDTIDEINLSDILKKYNDGAEIKKLFIVKYLPKVLICSDAKRSYASIDNLKDNINRLYNNFPEFTDFLRESTGLDTIPYDFFIRVNGIPAGVERSSEYLRFFSELLNDKEQKYYSEFYEFLDVLSYGTINY